MTPIPPTQIPPSPIPAEGDRQVFGWRLRTAIPLPHLSPWRPPLGTDDDGDPDVTITLGAGPASVSPAADAVRITAPEIGTFDILDDRTVTATLLPGADLGEVAAWVQGSVLGALCHRRGLLPLHAGCVALGDQAIVIIGDSGAGKSSLTAALVSRGGRLLAEDLCPVVWSDRASAPLALPSIPRVKLSPPALAHLGLEERPGDRIAGQPEKYAVFLAAMQRPLPITALYHIDPQQVADQPRLAPLTGLAKLRVIHNGIYRWDLAQAMGQAATAFQAAGRLADSVPAQRLWRTPAFAGIDAMASLILQDRGL